jgi:hypothetical protein
MLPCVAVAYLLKLLLIPVLPLFLAVVLSGGIPMLFYLLLAVSFDIVSVEKLYRRRDKHKKTCVLIT